MWNSSEHGASYRILFVLGIFIVLALAVAIGINKDALLALVKRSEVQPPRPPTQVVNTVEVVPVNEISPMVKSCLFSFLDSCAELIKDTTVVDENPVVDQTQNTGPESIAQQDIFYAIEATPNKGLANYGVPITKETAESLFPEFVADAEGGSLTVPAPIVIARVASKYNVNQRVLLTLMEVMNTGAGPLFSGSAYYEMPFFSSKPGFLSQLLAAAEQLQGSKAKYEIMLNEKGKLPDSVKFFDKEYLVMPNVNPETLAIVDFLGNNTKSKKQFEKTLYIPSETKEGVVSPDFNSLYKVMYKSDPRESL